MRTPPLKKVEPPPLSVFMTPSIIIIIRFICIKSDVIQSIFQAGWGYDFRRNMSVAWGDYGNYATDVFTTEAVNIIHDHNAEEPLFLYLAHLAVHSANSYSPLQAPQDAIDRHSYIKDENRRKFSGMLYKLDESVGKVVEALNKKKILQDCIIVFTTDNGGPAAGFDLNHASNWPLRGSKLTLFEGGTRTVSFIHSPKYISPRIETGMVHANDWFPTLLSAAGLEYDEDIDGVDQWEKIKDPSLPNPRQEMLYNLFLPVGNSYLGIWDELDTWPPFAAIRVGDWKYIWREYGFDGWSVPSEQGPD